MSPLLTGSLHREDRKNELKVNRPKDRREKTLMWKLENLECRAGEREEKKTWGGVGVGTQVMQIGEREKALWNGDCRKGLWERLAEDKNAQNGEVLLDSINIRCTTHLDLCPTITEGRTWS